MIKNLKHIENYSIIDVDSVMLSLHREKEKNVEGFENDGINDGERYVYNAMLTINFPNTTSDPLNNTGIIIQLAMSEFDQMTLLLQAIQTTSEMFDVEKIIDLVHVFDSDGTLVKDIEPFSITSIMEEYQDINDALNDINSDVPPTIH